MGSCQVITKEGEGGRNWELWDNGWKQLISKFKLRKEENEINEPMSLWAMINEIYEVIELSSFDKYLE